VPVINVRTGLVSFKSRPRLLVLSHPRFYDPCFHTITPSFPLVVSVRGVAPVANNLESAEHLAHGEETNNLGGDNADLLEGSRVHIADAVHEGLGVFRGRGAVDECRRVLESLGHRLEVGLNGLHGALMGVSTEPFGNRERFKAYGGAMLRPWTAIFPSSLTTRP
jgi:hypothetical protein